MMDVTRRRAFLRGGACRLALAAILLCLAARGHGAVVEKWLVIDTMLLDPACTDLPRPSIVVNQSFPGPTIECEDGDELIIHWTNKQDLPITVHWHGIVHYGSQWADGVEMVTQCPLFKNVSYTHRFQIVGQVGTFWYHAHDAQSRNTAHGALIVRPNHASNPEQLGVLLDNDFMLMAGDWYPQTAQALLKSVLQPPFGFPTPTHLHINGRTLCGQGPTVLQVRPRQWYRLRITNTGLWASFNLRVERHTMVLYEVEGGLLARRGVQMLDVLPGQSYSVLIFTNQAPANYWIVTNARFDVESAVRLPGVAILNYQGVTPGIPGTKLPAGPGPGRKQKNQFAADQESRLKSPYIHQELSTAGIDKLIVLELNFHDEDPSNKTGVMKFSINNVTYAEASVPLLLADYQNRTDVYSTTLMPELPPVGFATQKGGPYKKGVAVIEIPYGSWVQVVFQNHMPPGGVHPWHIHGLSVFVVGFGKGHFNASRAAQYKYNLRNPPMRTTVALQDGGWVAVRFKALNPGHWIVHCHLEPHVDEGLASIFKILSPGKLPNQPGNLVLSPPPDDFPTC